ncbi:MAG: hypothetical protein IKX22_07250 [Prevotella sp.]|nr:hypothetical protein [Prevotella sp.]
MKNTDRFELKVANGIDKPAIWFRLHEREVLVNPFVLYNLLWDCSRKDYFSRGITANFQIFKDEVCGYFHDNAIGFYNIEFERSSFVESALKALDNLCETTIKGELSAYKGFVTATAEQMKVGLNDLIIPRSYYQIREDEITVERFSFNFVEPYNFDSHFEITIGNRKYESYLSDWSNDFNRIRLEIEKSLQTYFADSEINLHYEDSPTIIRLRKKELYDSDYWPTNKYMTKVTIVPDGFSKAPNMFGWCDSRQLIRSLYLGLLSICVNETDWFDCGYDGNWEDFRLATYNKLQSCVIENYIKGVKEDDYTFFPRQRVIDSVPAMLEDYENLKQDI